MNKFTYSYPTKVYFGGGVAADADDAPLFFCSVQERAAARGSA